MCKEYNGWSNYFTWNFKSWIDKAQDLPLNNEIFFLSSRKYWQDSAEEFQKYDDIRGFEESLRAELQEAADAILPGESCLADLLRHAVESINFKEIAEYMMDELDGLTDELDGLTDDSDDLT